MDKARRLYPLAIKFGDGEQPSAAKLTGISTQAKNALGIVEFIVGDIWNQAGDPILSPSGTPTVNALHIANIARAVGRMSALNSLLPGTTSPMSAAMIYQDDVGFTNAGKNRAFLKYKPANTPTSVNMILAGTFAPLVQVQFKTDPKLIVTSGDWSVDANGKLYTFDSIPSTLVLQYVPEITSDIATLTGNTPSWNVIPDPTTWASGNYTGVKISFANNTNNSLGYHIWLPPRKPTLDSSYLLKHSPTVGVLNVAANPNSGSLVFYQSESDVASTTNADHYRYQFPKEITSVGGSGDTLPAGFLYIWDETTGTVIDGATFFVPGTAADRKFKVRVTGANLNTVFGTTIGNGIVTDDTTQIPADYKVRFKVITVGASLAKTVGYLNKNFWNHAHKLSEGGVPVSHADLDNLVTPGFDITLNNTYPSGIKSFRQSSWQNDDHPQYLHRAGSTMSAGSRRDRHDNCMLSMLGVKSPNTTDFEGRVNLAVTDDGTTATLSTSLFTTLNIGTTAWPVNLDNVQVNKRLYFSDTGSPSTALSNDYIRFDEIDNSFNFIGDGSSSSSAIVGGSLTATTVLGGTVRSVGNVVAAGDSTSSIRDGSHTYTLGRYQYLHIAPESIVLSAADQAAGLTFSVANNYIFNNDLANTFNIVIPVRFPNGAIITASEGIRLWGCGNGTTGLSISMFALTKPTSNGWSSLSSTTLISTTSTGVASTNAITVAPYGTTFTADNGFTGTSCNLVIAFPVKISSNTPKLWGITLQYRMLQVDN